MTAVVRVVLLAAGAGALALANPSRHVDDNPIPVRYAEGVLHGFLVLRDQAGRRLAHGDLLQVPRGDAIESRMVFRFADGSVHDERVTFTQDRVFTLIRYHLIQRGPAFPDDAEYRMDRSSGRYRVVTRARRGGEEDVLQGSIELPPDTYNGMVVPVAKNLPAGEARTVSFVAFTPKPRLIDLDMLPAAEVRVTVTNDAKPSVLYVLKPKLGAILGLFARLAGKQPPDNHLWIVTEDVPAFVKFEGALYMGGPVWRIELASPDWPNQP